MLCSLAPVFALFSLHNISFLLSLLIAVGSLSPVHIFFLMRLDDFSIVFCLDRKFVWYFCFIASEDRLIQRFLNCRLDRCFSFVRLEEVLILDCLNIELV